jgi:magnesium-transporting ATPase (P-type)
MVQDKLANTGNSPDHSWHNVDHALVVNGLQTNEEAGLTTDEAQRRLAQYGRNVLERKSAETPFQLLWRQINSPLIWVLIASSAVAMIADPVDGVKNGLVILAVVILNAIIGFAQEFRAGKAIEALKDFVPENAQVLRDGKKTTVPVADLVPGDIVFVASGDRVPADVRLTQLRTLLVEEAALTGESVPSEKSLALVSPDAPLGDRRNMAFGGTLVTQGVGTGVVVATAGKTELGRINTMLNEATELETPLSKSLKQIGTVLAVGIGVIAILMVIVGTARAMGNGQSLMDGLRESIIFAIALAVGAIPEGLPAIVTIALAIGVQRMAERRAVVRKLPSVETLGSTTVICSDKTGTLTKNEMTVQALWTPAEGEREVTGVGYEPVGEMKLDGQKVEISPANKRLVRFGAICSDATLEKVDGLWRITGDPTEGSLVVAAEKFGDDVEKLRQTNRRLDVIPFESDYQFMATLNQVGDDRMILMKGAPEVVLSRCENVDRDAVMAAVEKFAKQGMRVLGVAAKPFSKEHNELTFDDVESGMELIGLEGMIDPPRQEVIEAIRLVHGAGVTVKMITGDHKLTATAIGDQLNITDGKKAISGTELAQMSDDEIRAASKASNVFARVAPEHKLRLVRALQEEGQVTAMTGDGVNDAPALKQSNIGIAMGITGTSVSKEAADIVLTDDNFASIVAAVEEGRRVYDNLVKSLAFVLPTNLGLAMILIVAVAFFPFNAAGELLLPMLPTQLLWINLVATIALALPLAFEAKEPDVMRRKPRRQEEPVLSKFVIFRTFLVATLMTIGSVGLFLWQYETFKSRGLVELAIREGQTMAVTTVIMFQIFYLMNCRSLKDSVFKIGFFSNKMVFAGIASLLVLQAMFIYAPFMNQIFGSAPLSPMALGMSVLVGAMILPVITIEKLIRNRKSAA